MHATKPLQPRRPKRSPAGRKNKKNKDQDKRFLDTKLSPAKSFKTACWEMFQEEPVQLSSGPANTHGVELMDDNSAENMKQGRGISDERGASTKDATSGNDCITPACIKEEEGINLVTITEEEGYPVIIKEEEETDSDSFKEVELNCVVDSRDSERSDLVGHTGERIRKSEDGISLKCAAITPCKASQGTKKVKEKRSPENGGNSQYQQMSESTSE
ncbi:hypothetical protein NDU88_000002, partial [Pleurodeles waltl]